MKKIIHSSMKYFPFLSLALSCIIVPPASADVFSGTHPKLGDINLTMNSVLEPSRDGSSIEATFYMYAIRSGSIYAYGRGEGIGDAFNNHKTKARIIDIDNFGKSCSGKLNTSWRGSNLRATISYSVSKYSDCPVAGKVYAFDLIRQPNHVGMVIGPVSNSTEKIWMINNLTRQTATSYLIPGDLVDVRGSRRGEFVSVHKNGVTGYLKKHQILENQRQLSWYE